jgi:hypothetical protein
MIQPDDRMGVAGSPKKKMEFKMLIEKLLSFVEQTKRDLKMGRWVHMPRPSQEYQYYAILCSDHYEAGSYSCSGMISP